MKDFDLRKYLAEGKLLKEEIMVDPIIMFGGNDYIKDVLTSPDDFGFDKDDAEWVKNNILTAPKMVSIQDYMDLDDKWVKQAQIDTSGGGALDHVVDGLKIHVKQELITPEQEKEAMKVVGLSEGKLLKEEEFKLYTTNVEYDNGETGYMYQLVNSEDREENEIGFDQLFFDDKDNRLKMGVDFKDFDQGSYQDEEVSAEEAMKIYKSLAENKLVKEEEFKLYTTNVEYDNGEDGYMYQLVDAETGEENEIGFDQLHFDRDGNLLKLGVDFNDFEQTSYQDEEVSAEEAMKLYNELHPKKAMKNLNEGKKKKASAYMAELAEIDKQSAIVAMEAKINHLQEMADKKNERLKMVSEDENLSELIDSKKKKSMEREIKEIEKAKAKLEKVYEKMSGGKKKEIVDEDKEDMDETYSASTYEEDDSMNEEFLRMQKLAGFSLQENKILKEEKFSGAIIRKGTSDKAKEDTKVVRQALKKAGIKFTPRKEFGMDFKDADLAQIKKVIADAKVGEFIISRDADKSK